MKKFRYIALLLMLLQLTACGGGKTPQADDSTQPETSSETVSEETKNEISDDLPDTDLEGYEFRIMAGQMRSAFREGRVALRGKCFLFYNVSRKVCLTIQSDTFMIYAFKM